MTAPVPQQDRLCFDPQDYFDGLVADIEGAQREIILEIYIFRLDYFGRRVLRALGDAVDRGVRLRLLLDGLGSWLDAREIVDHLEGPRAGVRVFHPLPWDFASYRNALYADRWYSQLLYFIASINRRNHRKLCIIDHSVAWLGSFNITSNSVDLEDPPGDDHWHETGVRLSGPLLQGLRANFELVWQRKVGNFGERSRHVFAREPRTRRRVQKLELIQLLQGSASRIWITNAYFNPDRQLLRALLESARAGQSVQIIVPSRSDVFFFPALSRSFYSDLLQAGIRVFEYQRRILHSKTMLIDRQVLIGSTNLNYRSLRHDLEINALLDAPQLVERMERRFVEDLQDCHEVTPHDRPDNPLLQRFSGWLARFLRYWL